MLPPCLSAVLPVLPAELEYRVSGSPSGETIVLMMGSATPLVQWEDALLAALGGAGDRVVVCDYRDAGRSSYVETAGPDSVPELMTALASGRLRPPYTLDDIANDVTSLLDGLGIRSAHLVGLSLGGMLGQILAAPEWAEFVDRATAMYCIAVPNPELETAALRISSALPKTPSEIVRILHGRSPLELAAARLAGADWVDEYVRNLRHVGLEIDGQDLIAAGVSQGPAVGRGLAAALDAKLDGAVSGRDDELEVAVAAATAS